MTLLLRVIAVALLMSATFAAAVPVDPCQCEYADKASLGKGAEAIVSDFISQAKRAGLREKTGLTTKVDNTPQLIYFDPEHREMVVPWWADLDPAIQGMFDELAGCPPKGRRLFDILFNRFFIAHEAGHWLTFVSEGKSKAAPTDLDRDELHANQLAVAYWQTTSDGPAFLAELQGVLEPIMAKLPNPVPAGAKPADYFNQHYQELGQNPMAYAWFQFRLVLDALAQRDALKFPQVARSFLTKKTDASLTK